MAKLSPFPIFRAFNSNGAPLAGGKLYSFDAGTSTPRATFTDQGGGTPNANPVVLDANGEAEVWLDGNYKLQLDDASDVTQWTVDNIEQFATTINETLSPSANANAFQLTVSGTINEAASGTHTLLGGVRIDPPTINGGGASVTEVPTLYISSAPSAVGATPYALHVDAGATQLDGTLTVGGATVLTTVTSGDIAIEGSDATLTVKDTDGVFGTAIPSIDLRDSAGTLGATICINTSQELELINSISGSPVVLTTTGAGGFLRLDGDTVNGVGLVIRDTSTAVAVEVIAAVTFELNDSTNIGTLGFYNAADANFELRNQVSGGNLELLTTSGEVQIIDSNAKLVIQDTDGTWGVAIPSMEFQDSVGTVGASLGFDTNSDVILTNAIASADIVLTTNAGHVRIFGAVKPGLIIQDTSGVTTGAQCDLQFTDENGTILARLHHGSAVTSDLTLENTQTAADIKFTTQGTGDYVFTNLPTSDPVNAGALWNNAGVVNVSAG